MHKYEMDPPRIVEDTEWTLFCPQRDTWLTDGWRDKQTNGQQETNKSTFTFIEAGGYKNIIWNISKQ